MSTLEYKELRKQEDFGQYGAFGIQILVAASKLPEFDDSEIWRAASDAAENIKAAIMGKVLSGDEDCREASRNERAELLGVFPPPIFVEEIPNGYCSRWCCRHLPWFIVTTTVGRFKIGWRKRVIYLSWEETRSTKTAEELFASEDVTKETRMIHAWSVEDAKRYVEAILTSAEKATP